MASPSKNQTDPKQEDSKPNATAAETKTTDNVASVQSKEASSSSSNNASQLNSTNQQQPTDKDTPKDNKNHTTHTRQNDDESLNTNQNGNVESVPGDAATTTATAAEEEKKSVTQSAQSGKQHAENHSSASSAAAEGSSSASDENTAAAAATAQATKDSSTVSSTNVTTTSALPNNSDSHQADASSTATTTTTTTTISRSKKRKRSELIEKATPRRRHDGTCSAVTPSHSMPHLPEDPVLQEIEKYKTVVHENQALFKSLQTSQKKIAKLQEKYLRYNNNIFKSQDDYMKPKFTVSDSVKPQDKWRIFTAPTMHPVRYQASFRSSSAEKQQMRWKRQKAGAA